MGAKINLINNKFGLLTVVEETEQRKNNSVVWKCICDCGEIRFCSTKELRSDGVKSCKKCKIARVPQVLDDDIVGEKFNHLTVIEKTPDKQAGKLLYKCQCDCSQGSIVYRTKTDLKSGKSKSCGCHTKKYSIGEQVGSYTVIGFTSNKANPYFAKCNYCNNIYQINNFRLENNLSCGCQKISKGENEIEQLLINNNISYKREYMFENSKYRYDFAVFDNGQLIKLIEFDGELHYKDQIKNAGWSTIEKYQETKIRDEEKNKLALSKNIPLIRIPYWERGNISIKTLEEDKYLIKEQIK